MVKQIAVQKHPKILGRHTRLGLPFRWRLDGTLVDLEADGYTVRVWIAQPDGTTISGPHAATVSGTEAVYQLSASDLTQASPALNNDVHITAVAENDTNTLVSDARGISVGQWFGADSYEPVV